MSQATDASLVSVDAAASLVEAGVLMMARGLPCLPVLRHGTRVGTLDHHEITRALRGAGAARTVAEVIADRDAVGDDPPPAPDPPGDPLLGGEPDLRFQPDVLLSSQYVDRVRRSAEFEPERRLMVAVLEQCVNDYVKHLVPRDANEIELWRDAAAWIEDDDATWLYSFRRICDTLGIDADYLRRGLRAARVRGQRPAPVREEQAREEPAAPAAKRASAGSG